MKAIFENHSTRVEHGVTYNTATTKECRCSR